MAAESFSNKRSRSKPLAQELMQRIDGALTDILYGDQPQLGARSSDQRRAVWLPTSCQFIECHRFVFTIDYVNRAYGTYNDDGLACRCCAPASLWAVTSRKPPSELERKAYTLLQYVFGTDYWYFFEVHVHRKSIDILLMHKTTYNRIAVHVDGRQHVHKRASDVDFDMQLHDMQIATIRLPADRQCQWLHMLEDFKHINCKNSRYPPLPPSWWCLGRTQAGCPLLWS